MTLFGLLWFVQKRKPAYTQYLSCLQAVTFVWITPQFTLIQSGLSGLYNEPLWCLTAVLLRSLLWVCVTLTQHSASPAGEGRRAVLLLVTILQRAAERLPPSLALFRRAFTAKCFRSREDMAGYLKVLSSLSRSAGAAFSRNPAVLAPAANCQTLQQRNCKWRDSRFIPSIIMLTVNCSLTWPGVNVAS